MLKSAGEKAGESKVDEVEIPSELLCELCKGVIRDAVIITCCSEAFCDECECKVVCTGVCSPLCTGVCSTLCTGVCDCVQECVLHCVQECVLHCVQECVTVYRSVFYTVYRSSLALPRPLRASIILC